MKLNHKIISVFLIMAIFAFNLVLLPAQAADGCACDHPHGEDGVACFCGKSSLKASCDSKGPSLSRNHCGLDKKSSDFSIPANEHPTLLSTDDAELVHQISVLNTADRKVFSDLDLLPIEHPPSVL